MNKEEFGDDVNSERNRILDDIFFKKYLKFKKKYLELNGGLPLSKEERKIKQER
jgi:hypothetical protein